MVNEIRKNELGWDIRVVKNGKLKIELMELYDFFSGKTIYFVNGMEKKYKQLTNEEKEMFKKTEQKIESMPHIQK